MVINSYVEGVLTLNVVPAPSKKFTMVHPDQIQVGDVLPYHGHREVKTVLPAQNAPNCTVVIYTDLNHPRRDVYWNQMSVLVERAA